MPSAIISLQGPACAQFLCSLVLLVLFSLVLSAVCLLIRLLCQDLGVHDLWSILKSIFACEQIIHAGAKPANHYLGAAGDTRDPVHATGCCICCQALQCKQVFSGILKQQGLGDHHHSRLSQPWEASRHFMQPSQHTSSISTASCIHAPGTNIGAKLV